MRLWGTREAKAADGGTIKPLETASALTAAALEIDLKMPSGWQFFTLGDRRWQFEAWKHYDICGELRFLMGWKASAVSRCRMYAAVLDDNGVPGDEADDETVRGIVDTLFGNSPPERAENLRTTALNIELTGESFPIVYDQGQKDEHWFIASTSEIFKRGDQVMVRRPMNTGAKGGPVALKPGRDMLGRIWTPHPRRYDAADSAVRPALIKLRELEQATKQVFASIDSRLAAAGMLLLPDTAVPPPLPGGSPRQMSLPQYLARTMATALQDPGSASARVPIIVQMAADEIAKVAKIDFNFEITPQVLDIREKAVMGLARSLDCPPEVLMGTGDVSHWSSWAIEESSIKLHIEPLLVRIADGINRVFFQPMLRKAGVANPEKYTIWFDITQLAIRPNRSDQANQLGERGLISDEAVRQANGFEETDKPSEEERVRKLLTQVLIAQPLYAADPVVAKALGLPPGIQNPMGGAGMPQLGAGPTPVDPNDPNADPEALLAQLEAANGSDATAADAGGAQGPPQMDQGAPPPNTRTAALAVRSPGPTPFMVATHAAVHRALEVAGGRIVPGPGRNRYPDVPRAELHTRVIPTADKIDKLLEGAWASLAASVAFAAPHLGAGEVSDLADDLTLYCQALLTRGTPHSPELLREYLAAKSYPV